MYSVVVTEEFSAAHFLSDEGVHGHNYKVEVEVRGTPTNGKVVDFRIMKRYVRALLSSMDHKVLIPEQSKRIDIKVLKDAVTMKRGSSSYEFPRTDARLLPIEEVSAEYLAEYVFNALKGELQGIHAVRVWENDRSFAQFHSRI